MGRDERSTSGLSSPSTLELNSFKCQLQSWANLTVSRWEPGRYKEEVQPPPHLCFPAAFGSIVPEFPEVVEASSGIGHLSTGESHHDFIQWYLWRNSELTHGVLKCSHSPPDSPRLCFLPCPLSPNDNGAENSPLTVAPRGLGAIRGTPPCADNLIKGQLGDCAFGQHNFSSPQTPVHSHPSFCHFPRGGTSWSNIPD